MATTIILQEEENITVSEEEAQKIPLESETTPHNVLTLLLMKLLKSVVLVLICATVLFYIVLWLLTPITRIGSRLETIVTDRLSSHFLSNISGTYLLYSGPILVLSLLGLLFLELNKTSFRAQRSWRCLSTQPVFVNKLMGVVTGMDFVVILMVLFAVVWIFVQFYLPQAHKIDTSTPPPGTKKWILKLAQAAIMLGRTLAFSIALLFIPVSRSSPIMRMLDVPFEYAVKYHKWLGHITLTIVFAHSVIFITIFSYENKIAHLVSWRATGIAVLAGFIATVSGMIMWITSAHYIRVRFFDLFYRAHHLYLVFVVFFVFHVGVQTAGYAMGSIVLFFIDRYMRFWQSRRLLTTSSVRILHDNIVELKFLKSPGLKYTSLSFIYINLPQISYLQWHPFSIASSPLDGTQELTVYIKPLGTWTQSLKESIQSPTNHHDITKLGVMDRGGAPCPLSMALSAEGPYGHETNFFLRYETLVLIAGGIGITPFMAILRDLLHRHQSLGQGAAGVLLPSTVELVWCVRRTQDLDILKQICPAAIFQGITDSNLKIVVKVYVTQPSLESLNLQVVEDTPNLMINTSAIAQPANQSLRYISPVAGTGNNMWVAAVIISSLIGFVLMLGIFQTCVIDRYGHPTLENPYLQWKQVVFFFLSMIMGIGGFGGVVMFAWRTLSNNVNQDLKEQNLSTGSLNIKTSKLEKGLQESHLSIIEVEGNNMPSSLLDQATIKEGERPNFSEFFDNAKEVYVDADVGVLVSGPESLLHSVAVACRNQIFKSSNTKFHYHSVSFSL
ncbi:unnamed protein product [Sphagnum balticum]